MREVFLEEIDHAFADDTAEIESGGGVVGAEQATKLHGGFGEFSDLEDAGLAVPERRVFEDVLEFFADGLDGERVVNVDEDYTDDFGSGASPVLKWFVDEIGEGKNEAAEVPQADYDVAGFDFFDPAPFVFDDYRVVNADWLSDGDLKSGDEAGESGAGGHTDDDAGDSGGSENAGADLASAGEGHQHGGEADDNDGTDEHAFEDFGLGVDAASMEIVTTAME